MANPQHLEILKRGWREWNKWRLENPNIEPDLADAYLTSDEFPSAQLRRAILSKADLSRVSFIGRNLREIDLSGANLTDVHFGGIELPQANLRSATLLRANLNGAILDEALLDNANFQYADLRQVRFFKAQCKKTDFRNAQMTFSVFAGANLIGAKLTNANLLGANLTSANLRKADLRNSNLTMAVLVDTILEGANLSGCRIYGISAWGINTLNSTQQNLIITPELEPEITVDNLKVAQFIYLLLNNSEIRNVIDTVSRKSVLILGRFTPERKAVLDAIREELRNRDYLPILFDFDKPATRDLTETVRTLAHLSRFIIADITDPRSIPLELQAVVPDLAVPVQPLLLRGQREFGMFNDLRKYPWVLATHQYTDINDLLASLGDKVIAPAEQKAKELEKR
jgi:uncharacterized protein YjbI with pentapeptide repeats